MDYKEFVNELGLTLPQARQDREKLLTLSRKADLGFKISLVHLALYPISIFGGAISMGVFEFLFGLIFILPFVALALGGFKRLMRGALDITARAMKIIPIFPINLIIAVIVFSVVVSLFVAIPFPFFWKMRKNIQFDLEVAEDVIKRLEAEEQA